MNNESRIIELVEELNAFAVQYYKMDNPSISDKEYDQKYDELLNLEKETGIVLPYSPSQRVGDGILGQFHKYTHKGRLWSLDKAQTFEQLKDWTTRVKKLVNQYNLENIEKLPELNFVLTKKFKTKRNFSAVPLYCPHTAAIPFQDDSDDHLSHDPCCSQI